MRVKERIRQRASPRGRSSRRGRGPRVPVREFLVVRRTSVFLSSFSLSCDSCRDVFAAFSVIAVVVVGSSSLRDLPRGSSAAGHSSWDLLRGRRCEPSLREIFIWKLLLLFFLVYDNIFHRKVTILRFSCLIYSLPVVLVMSFVLFICKLMDGAIAM